MMNVNEIRKLGKFYELIGKDKEVMDFVSNFLTETETELNNLRRFAPKDPEAKKSYAGCTFTATELTQKYAKVRSAIDTLGEVLITKDGNPYMIMKRV